MVIRFIIFLFPIQKVLFTVSTALSMRGGALKATGEMQTMQLVV